MSAVGASEAGGIEDNVLAPILDVSNRGRFLCFTFINVIIFDKITLGGTQLS